MPYLIAKTALETIGEFYIHPYRFGASKGHAYVTMVSYT